MAHDTQPDPGSNSLPDLLRGLTSAAAVAHAIDAQQQAFHRFALAHASHSPGFEYHEDAELTWVCSGQPSPMANYVSRTALPGDAPPERAQALVDRMVAFFTERSLPFSWRVGPLTAPADLDRRLVARGFRLAESDDWYALALEPLASLGSLPTPAPTEGVEIVRIADGAAHEQWIETLAAHVFGEGLVPEAQREKALAAWRRMGYDGPQRLYLARLHGEPAATALLFFGGGVAGLYQVHTAERARNRGIGTALIVHALRCAAAAGYHVAVLSATAMGLPIYTRLGFRPYATYSTYVYGEPAP